MSWLRRFVCRPRANIPAVTTATATHGAPGSLIGTLRAGEEPLEAPFSGRACVYFEASVLASKRGLLVVETRHAHGAFLQDAAGVAKVDLSNYPVPPVIKIRWPYEVTGVSTERVRILAERYPHATTEILNPERFYERVLLDGEEVLVQACCLFDTSPGQADAVYRQTPPRLTLKGTKQQPLYISNLPWELKR